MLEPGKAKIYSSKNSFGGGGFAGTSYWVDPSEALIGIIAIQNPGWSWDAQNKFPALVYQAIND
jgi:CubicO group peptidase (beta-lactamase class C family)